MLPKLLRRDVLLLLGAKGVALALIYFIFIAPATKREPDRAAMQAHLLSDHPQ
jgi:hypothetical protein